MIQRMAGAFARAVLVAFLIALPALMLPGASQDAVQLTSLLCVLAAVLTYMEYRSDYPSFVEFRDAAPFNRIRFLGLTIAVISFCLVLSNTVAGHILGHWGSRIGSALDFSYSPVWLMLTALQDLVPDADTDLLRQLCGVGLVVMFGMLLSFPTIVRILNWPIGNGAFNVWINLPLFDPTAGGDVLARLRRDGYFNIALGILMPFLFPVVLKLLAMDFVGLELANTQTLVWIFAGWVFLPSSLIMRGLALMRVAHLVQEKRRRAYAQLQLQPA